MEYASQSTVRSNRFTLRVNGIQLISVLALWLVFLYLIFDYSFTQVRLPFLISEGIPAGELILILTLPVINHARIFSRLGTIINLVPLLLWWSIGFTQVIVGFMEHGAWALRDATSLIESLFILFGFALASSKGGLQRFFDWLPKLLLIVCIYCLGYPIKDWLAGFVPVIQSAAGAPVPLLFTYTSKYLLLLFTASYLFIYPRSSQLNSLLYQILIIGLVGFSVIFFQVRSIYFQILALIYFYSRFEFQKSSRFVWIVVIAAALVMTLPIFGLEVRGRLGETTSVQFIMDHFLSSFGITGEGVEGSANGVFQRFDWWSTLLDKWLSSFSTFFFGLGYGIPLTDFSSLVQVREPHNSYLSTLMRLGLAGFLAFTWLHVLLIRAWKRAYTRAKRMGWLVTQRHLLWIMSFFVLIWIQAFAQDTLEKPFFAIPYYFFWGVMLGMFYYIKKAYLNTEKPDENSAYP